MTPSPPIDAAPPAEKSALRLKKSGSASFDYVPEPPAKPAPPPSSDKPSSSTTKTRHPSLGATGYVKPVAWLLFFVLGGFMGALRYGGFLNLQPLLTAYGPWAILFFHVVVILLAFDEDFFTGVLCILVPGFSLYYLVARAGRPFLTALVFGLLVGVGEDTYALVKEFSMETYENITDLIAGNRRK